MDWVNWLELAGLYSIAVSVAMIPITDATVWGRGTVLILTVFSLVMFTWLFVQPCREIVQ